MVLEEYGTTDAFDEFVADGDPETVRQTLLGIDGVGPKTTDCVLLFSGSRGGVFPVYTPGRDSVRGQDTISTSIDPGSPELCRDDLGKSRPGVYS